MAKSIACQVARLSVWTQAGVTEPDASALQISDPQVERTGPVILPLEQQETPWCVVKDGRRLMAAAGDSIQAGHPRHDGRQDFYKLDIAASSTWFWLRMQLEGYFVENQAIGSTTGSFWLSAGSGSLCPPAEEMLGARSQQAKIYKTAFIYRPQYLFFGVGVNDLGGGFAMDFVIECVDEICDVAAELGIIPVVMCTPHMKRADASASLAEELAPSRAPLNELYQELVARKEYEAYCVDFASLLHTPEADGRAYFADHVHPNAGGYRIIAAEIARTIPFIEPARLQWIVFHWDGAETPLPAGFVMPRKVRLVFAAPDHINPERGFHPEATSGYTTAVAATVANSSLAAGYAIEVLIPDKPQSTFAIPVPEFLAAAAYEVLISIVECYDQDKAGICTGFTGIEYVYR